jgi:thioredoxin 1
MLKLINFSAKWCQPCKIMKPILREIKKETDIEIIEIDVEKNPEKAQEFNIISIPTFLLYKDDVLIDSFIGAMSKEVLLKLINFY